MNRKVLLTMIVLLWFFLFAFMAIKLFFPNELVAVVENTRIREIGDFIDNNLWVRVLVDSLVGILTMHFYLCSCKQRWRLSLSEYIIVIAYSFGITLLKLVTPIFNWADLVAPLVLPLLLKFNSKQSLCVFILHTFGQPLLLLIRSEPLYLVSTNYATQFILLFDVYIWLVLYYTYSNLYKEKTLWENLSSSFSVIRQKLNLKRSSKE